MIETYISSKDLFQPFRKPVFSSASSHSSKKTLKSEQIDMSNSVLVTCAILASIGEQYLEILWK